jgi:acyl-CoA synthetase (AMP-forming)/AMP-acid ligase II
MEIHADIIDRNARQHGAKEAFCDESGRRTTWAQYAERSRRLGSAMHRLGLRRQDRYALLAMNSLEYYELYGAADMTGFIPALLNFRLAPPEYVAILKDSAPKIFFYEEQYAEVVAGLRRSFPEITHYISIDGGASPLIPDAIAWADFMASGDPEGAPLRAQPEHFAYLYYTSGTTGKAKGVVHNHRQNAAISSGSAYVSGINGASVVLQTTPAYHIGGRCYVSSAMWPGAKTVVHRMFDPVKVIDAIEKEKVTFTFMVAAMIQAVLDTPGVEKRDLKSIDKIVSAAAPIPVPLLKRAISVLGPVFGLQYGSTEAGMVCDLPKHEVKTQGTPAEVKLLGSIGHPAPGVKIRILDDDGIDCKVGEIGELVIKSEGMLSGYWNNHVATIEAMRDGWYRSGDMGYYDENGYITLADRRKDMIITGGENVYSREVEEAIHLHPEVVESAVIGIPHPKWVETVMAIVVRKKGAKVDEGELVEFTKTQIARYKCPTKIAFMDELPRLPNGKINKVALRATYR